MKWKQREEEEEGVSQCEELLINFLLICEHTQWSQKVIKVYYIILENSFSVWNSAAPLVSL